MRHRFTQFVAASTIVLMLAGSLVTSHDAGLSVPDWPTTYGWNMFTFPPSLWVANILYEHGHRLIASGVGLLTILLMVWLWVVETGACVKWLGPSRLARHIRHEASSCLTRAHLLPS